MDVPAFGIGLVDRKNRITPFHLSFSALPLTSWILELRMRLMYNILIGIASQLSFIDSYCAVNKAKYTNRCIQPAEMGMPFVLFSEFTIPKVYNRILE
jgi:hypothetical protein